jgi:hypothetical protein
MRAFYVNAVTWLAERQLRLSISPTSVIGGLQNAVGTVTLLGPMPSGGLQVHLYSSNSQLGMVPNQITIGPASKSASFTITTTNPPIGDSVFIQVYDDTASANGYLGVLPQPTTTTPPGTVYDLEFDPYPAGFGETIVGTVTLVPPAQPYAVTVALSGDQPRFATVPPSVTVPAGQTTAAFTVNTFAPRTLPRLVTVGVSASAGASRSSASFHWRDSEGDGRKDLADLPDRCRRPRQLEGGSRGRPRWFLLPEDSRLKICAYSDSLLITAKQKISRRSDGRVAMMTILKLPASPAIFRAMVDYARTAKWTTEMHKGHGLQQ